MFFFGSIFFQDSTTMSDEEEPVLIHTFHYYEVTNLRGHENEVMARLNYMASRIRSALFRWNVSLTGETAEEWWWKGLKNELVRTPNVSGKCLHMMKVGLCDGNCWACCRYDEYFPRCPPNPSGAGSVDEQAGGTGISTIAINDRRN